MIDEQNVLVVEDDRALNDLVCRLVKLAGFSATPALDGNSAIALAQKNPPGVVLLDLMLPDTTGFEVCRELKQDERTRRAPVIVLTALSDDDSRNRARECGAIEYLVKPFNIDVLLDVLRKYAVER